MSYSLVQQAHGSGNSGTSASASYGSATTAGNLLVLLIVGTKNPGDVTFTPPTNWQQAGSTIHDDVFIAVSGACYYYKNNPGGITSVATTISSAVTGWDVVLLEYSGVDTSTALDAATLASAVGTGNHSVSATMSGSDDLLIGFALLDEAGAANTLSGLGAWTALTSVQDGGGWAGIFPFWMTASGSGSQSFAPTYGGNSDGIIGIAGFIAGVTTTPLTASAAVGKGTAAAAVLSTSVPLTASAAVGKGTAQNAALTISGQLVASAAVGKATAQTATLDIAVALTASAAVGQAVAQTATLSFLDPLPSIPPAVLPLISRDLPAFSSEDGQAWEYLASRVDNDTYGDFWRSVRPPNTVTDGAGGWTDSPGNPVWIALDVSSVTPGKVLVNLLNEQGNLYLKADDTDATSLFVDYVLQGNAADGGTESAPSSNWDDLETVTGNLYPTRQHQIDLTGYNWLRLYVTASAGDAGVGNNDVSVQIDIHDATAGHEDTWLFLGDSITLEGMLHPELGGGDWGYGGALANIINTARPSYYPATIDGGNGGQTMTWAATNIDGLLNGFSGGWVSLAFGTNDCNGSGVFTAGDTNVLAIYAALLTCIDAAAALNNRVIVPYIPYGPNHNGGTGDLGANANLVNEYVDAHLPTDRPDAMRGPDFWSFFNAHPDLIRNDAGTTIHPTYVEVGGAASGYEEMHLLWADWLETNVYTESAALIASPAVGRATTQTATLTPGMALVASAATGKATTQTATMTLGVALVAGPTLGKASATAAAFLIVVALSAHATLGRANAVIATLLTGLEVSGPNRVTVSDAAVGSATLSDARVGVVVLSDG